MPLSIDRTQQIPVLKFYDDKSELHPLLEIHLIFLNV